MSGAPQRIAATVGRAMRGLRHVRVPLNLKLSVLIVALLAVTVLLVSGFLLRSQQETLTDEMRKRGLAIAHNLAAGARSALLTKDDLALALLVRDVTRDPDIAYVAITDRNGTVLAHSDPGMLARGLERPADAEPLGAATVVQPLSLQRYGDVVEVATPLTFRQVRIGAAYVGFSQAGIRGAVAQAREHAVLITVAMLGVGIAGAVALAAMLSRPIIRLMQATRAVASGDLSVVVPVTSRDELGALTRAFNDMAQSLREKEMIKRAFSRYVAREVVEEILKDPARLTLRGERREVTVLFCDIRGFTAMAASLSPEEVVDLLNAFYDLMIDTTFKHDGTLDKFLGDGIMAVFGAPLARADHTMIAARTALAMQTAVQELSARRVAAGKVPFTVGIGLNTGDAIAGTVGTDERMEYTVVGDCVNVAARLQSHAGRGQTLVSVGTYARLAGAVRGRPLGLITIKGKDEKVEVWELLGLDEP